jgi:hypothetical protein
METDMKKTLIGSAFLAALFVYHLGVCAFAFNQGEIKGAGKVSINPLTNVVSFTLDLPKTESPGLAKIGMKLGAAIGAPMAERELNVKARRYCDIYAIIVPFKVDVDIKEN